MSAKATILEVDMEAVDMDQMYSVMELVLFVVSFLIGTGVVDSLFVQSPKGRQLGVFQTWSHFIQG